jgi:hypothetical protein
MNDAFARSSALLVATTALLVGCTGHLNRSDTLTIAGAEQPLPDLEGRMPGELPANEGPSLTSGRDGSPASHDRSHWERTTVAVAPRQVEVQPHFVDRVAYDRGTGRARGDAPTRETALELGGDGGAQALEALAAPFRAAADLVFAPVRFLATPPGATVRSPAEPPRPNPTLPPVAEAGA